MASSTNDANCDCTWQATGWDNWGTRARGNNIGAVRVWLSVKLIEFHHRCPSFILTEWVPNFDIYLDRQRHSKSIDAPQSCLGAPSEKSARVQLLSMVQQRNSFGENTCCNHEIGYPGERCPTFFHDIPKLLPTFTSERHHVLLKMLSDTRWNSWNSCVLGLSHCTEAKPKHSGAVNLRSAHWLCHFHLGWKVKSGDYQRKILHPSLLVLP